MNNMIPVERRQKMLALINEQGTVTIADLSNVFTVSEMTIHRDLKFLEASGWRFSSPPDQTGVDYFKSSLRLSL